MSAPDHRTQLELAIGVIRDLRKKVEALEGGRKESVAIVGMGCRFPGPAQTPEQLWDLVAGGVDAVGEVPGERLAWRNADPAIRKGAFLPDVDLFDATLFGIAPREAERMDPQHRLVLEVAWNALEHAGQDVDRLRGSRTGVFLGIHSGNVDYYLMQLAGPAGVDTYTGTGCAQDAAAGRLSYLFDWRGPSLAINTACSSSLVAVHLACQSLRSGESDMALAGGVNVMVGPSFSEAVSHLNMLSPDGRSKPFDRRANGFVRGEGCGFVVLKRLADAVAQGDRVLAVIRGSAVNQDGRSNGLTAPNGRAQEAVIRAALEQAGIEGSRIGYVEAHGTGTALGDPIEIEALAATVGAAAPGAPACVLGSVKANLGHLESCAGVAGLIKAVLCLQRRVIPPLLHFRELNPHISLEGTRLLIPRETLPWPSGPVPRCAGVSSFGWSGTNAHVVLEEAPGSPAIPEADDAPLVLPLSAHTGAALRELAAGYAGLLRRETAPALRDLCHTAACRRTHHAHRAATVARSSEELLRQLDVGLDAGERPASGPPPVAFVFCGQGPQWWGMGREMLESSPPFRAALERCAAAMDFDLLAEMRATESASRLSQTLYAQPALFALQVALAEQWAEWGVRPAAVVGHSVGEIAAACVAGALSIEEGARIVCRRGRVMQQATGRGIMVSVAAEPEELDPLIAESSGQASIAAINAPGATVIAGEAAAVDRIVARLGRDARRLPVDYAFHSPQMDPYVAPFASALGHVEASDPRIMLVSTVTGSPVRRGQDLCAAHWAGGIRRPVRFRAAVESLLESGYRIFVQIGPHPVVASAVAECARSGQRSVRTPASLRRGKDERATMLVALAELYRAGCDPDWTHVNPPGRVVSLPLYPMQRKRFWLPEPEPQAAPAVAPDDWFYRIAWEPSPLARSGSETLMPEAAPETVQSAGDWLLLGEGGRLAQTFSACIRAQGGALADPARRTNLRAILHVSSPGGPQSPDVESGVSLLRLVQELASCSQPAPRVWVVTCRTQPVGQAPVEPAAAPVWGLGRIMALEYPELWGGVIDVDGDSDSVAQNVLREVLSGAREDLVAWRGETRYAGRLMRAVLPARPAPRFSAEGVYLVTGGLGMIGRKVARWLVDRGARHLVLVGRSGLGDRRSVVDGLRERGAEVVVEAADVGDRAAVSRLLENIARGGRPLCGVFHAAVDFHLEPVSEVTRDSLERSLAAKARGAWLLDELTRSAPLDSFVLFSSAAASIGARHMAAYAAANEYLAALAERRRGLGLPATVIDWGAWDQIGSVSNSQRESVFRAGFRPMAEAAALDALGRVMASGAGRITVADIDWSVLKGAMEARARRPLLERIQGASAAPAPAPALATDPAVIADFLRREVRRALGLEADAAVDPEQGFFSMGMDSLMAVEFRRRIEAASGLDLPNTLLFNFPNLAALTAYLRDALGGAKASPQETAGELDGISDQEVRRLLAEELRSLPEEFRS